MYTKLTRVLLELEEKGERPKHLFQYTAPPYPVAFNTDADLGRGSQRDVVYVGWPIAPSYMSPNAGEGGCGASSNEYSCAHGAQTNFEDLTSYLTYGS